MDVSGDVDISGGLSVDGIAKFDKDNNGDFLLEVDASQAGLSSSGSGRSLLDSGAAHMDLDGDLQMHSILADQLEVAESLQAFGDVGLGASGKSVTAYGSLAAKLDATVEGFLKVDLISAGVHGLVADESAQSSTGLEISAARVLDSSNGAFLTLADGKDMLVKGSAAIGGDAIVGESIWFGDYLKSKAEFKMQDSFTDGASPYVDHQGQDQYIHGYVLASSAADVQALIDNSPEAAVVEIDDGSGNMEKHVSIISVLASLVSGGEQLRYEEAFSGFIAKNTEIQLTGAPILHDGDSLGDGAFKDVMKLYVNGLRLSKDDFELVQGQTTKIKFNFAMEEDDVLLVDIADPNPIA